MGQKVIVLRNNEYLIDEIIDDITPTGLQLRYPNFDSSNKMILKNLVVITLKLLGKFVSKNSIVIITYKDIEIYRVWGGMEQVLSSISAFKDYSVSKLDEIIKNINDEENKELISALENRIEELKIEKSNLENEVKDLKEIKDSANKIIEYAEIFKNAIETTTKVES